LDKESQIQEVTMSQRSALIVSAALTAFVLFLAGAVIGRFSRAEVAPTAEVVDAASPEATASPAADAAVDPQALTSQEAQMYLDREAAYRDLVGQANERLQAAYTQLQAQASAPVASAMQAQITAAEAAAIALQAAPGAALLSNPVLTVFQNLPAYQVVLTAGVLMVDARSGVILFNSATTLATAAHPGSGSLRERSDAQSESGQGGHSGGEHEQEGGGGDH
jgi:hypothetical protein